jgi:hypothetical protein
LRDIALLLWGDELTRFRSNHCFNLAPGETPTVVGTGTLQSAHDFVLECHVLRQCDVLVVGVIEQEGERELGWSATTISPFESARTVVHQLETSIECELFLVRLFLDYGAASTTVADVDDVDIYEEDVTTVDTGANDDC